MKTNIGVAAIITDESGNYLLHLRDSMATRHPNQWYLVGGHPEGAETPAQGIIREVKEETGLTFEGIKLFKTLSLENTEVYIFEGKVNRGTEEMVLGEGNELRFFGGKNSEIFLNGLNYTNEYLEALKVFLQRR